MSGLSEFKTSLKNTGAAIKEEEPPFGKRTSCGIPYRVRNMPSGQIELEAYVFFEKGVGPIKDLEGFFASIGRKGLKVWFMDSEHAFHARLTLVPTRVEDWIGYFVLTVDQHLSPLLTRVVETGKWDEALVDLASYEPCSLPQA